MLAIPLSSNSWSLILVLTVTVILTLITNTYYWFVVPRALGARNVAATFRNDVGKIGADFPGIWWIRSSNLLCLCSGFALLLTSALGVDGVAIPLGYYMGVSLLLTEVSISQPSSKTMLITDTVRVRTCLLQVG
jgi:hypothetical protein